MRIIWSPFAFLQRVQRVTYTKSRSNARHANFVNRASPALSRLAFFANITKSSHLLHEPEQSRWAMTPRSTKECMHVENCNRRDHRKRFRLSRHGRHGSSAQAAHQHG